MTDTDVRIDDETAAGARREQLQEQSQAGSQEPLQAPSPGEPPDGGLRFVDVSAALPLAVPLADTLAGPGWVALWADAIVCFWENELALGALDPREPVYLLDVAPGRGVLAWLLIDALDARLPSSRAAALDWRYLVCSEQREPGEEVECGEPDAAPDDIEENESRAALRRLHTHPRFAALIDAGRVDTACWPLAEGGALQPDGRPSPIERAANPVVVLAAGWFSRQPAEMYGVHYGEWLEAKVDVSADEDAQHYTLSYRWQPASPDDLDAAWKPLAERYLTSLVSARVLLSSHALALVDAVARISGERYLLLACDVGISGEAALRDSPPLASDTWVPGESMLPVNFHALAWRQRDAWLVQRHLGTLGLVLHAAWSRAGDAPPAEARATLNRLVERCEPGDALHFAHAVGSLAEHAPFERLLALLRSSAYDPSVLTAMLPHWAARAAQPDAVPVLIAQGWRHALAQTWRRHLPGAYTVQFDAQLADAAALLGSWGLAKEIWRSVLALDEGPGAAHDAGARAGGVGGAQEVGATHDAGETNDARDDGRTGDASEADEAGEADEADEADEAEVLDHAGWRARVHVHLAHCLASSGALPAALTHLTQARALAPGDADIHAWHAEFDARLARQRALPWYRPDLARDGGLAIEPLGPEHADALFAAYADPHIAPLANLPVFNELPDVLTWLDQERAEPGRTSYAVMDVQQGFVGVVSLCCAGDAAYFYFWIGAGAQGKGFGTRAARLLFAQARAAGIVDIFTASYLSNGRSFDALQRLGFSRLPAPPANDPNIAFFYRSDAGDAAARASLPETLERYEALCEAIDAAVTPVSVTADAVSTLLDPERHDEPQQ